MHRVAITEWMVLRTVCGALVEPEILGGLNRDFLSTQLHYLQQRQDSPSVIEVSFAVEALQDLSQNQVADGNGS
jgi:hypothetical protein